MTKWFDLRGALPGLRGPAVHVVAEAREREVMAVLDEAGFVVRRLDGRGIRDEVSFFEEAARALHLPDHFGHNWDALEECLHRLGEGRSRRLALLWQGADRSLAADPQLVLDATALLADVARDLGGEDPPTQLEVFLLGESPAFSGSGSRTGHEGR
jgi:RNAse (barnase) inhibitor barstar